MMGTEVTPVEFRSWKKVGAMLDFSFELVKISGDRKDSLSVLLGFETLLLVSLDFGDWLSVTISRRVLTGLGKVSLELI